MAFTIILFGFSTFNSYAINVGDKIGNVLNSDIKTYIDDYRIPSYTVDGKTVIVAEDLKNYGFDVTYSNSERTLTIVRNETKKFTPIQNIQNNTKKVGSVAFPYVYTDIKVKLGNRTIASFSINGSTVIFTASP
ncbi:hypothetical protein FACS1894105_11410 [Clostridia bacterium]|nr:hypothetical protein FACS1894105_11410 [Clostridia bacterium]